MSDSQDFATCLADVIMLSGGSAADACRDASGGFDATRFDAVIHGANGTRALANISPDEIKKNESLRAAITEKVSPVDIENLLREQSIAETRGETWVELVRVKVSAALTSGATEARVREALELLRAPIFPSDVAVANADRLNIETKI